MNIIILLVIIYFFYALYTELFVSKEKKLRKKLRDNYGSINVNMVCPHCNMIGKVRTKKINVKKGVSGSKATAGLLTGGLSLLVVGLSRQEELTKARCDNCKNTWGF